MQADNIPMAARILAYYFIIGSLPAILFALFGFTIPAEEISNQPAYIERDRVFITLMKILMFGALLLYSLAHLFGGVGLIRGKKWGYNVAWILSLSIFHLNPFSIPGLIVCLRKDVQEFYNETND